ncbi:SDR family oxidoreductase [Lichenicoccus sp.]|uniref:SDR family oxidoreductase n=1 Tax=Lichenicoccus sp. TaxID=2781899 RepID=UPI003D0A43DD
MRRPPDALPPLMRRSPNTVLITGGASGIGLALATRLVQSGNVVIACGRDQGRLDAARATCPGLRTIQADVATDAGCRSLVACVTQDFPKLDILVNNAGLLHLNDLRGATLTRELEAEFAVNLLAPVALANLLLPTLLRQPEAAIVNVTTGYVFLPSARAATYSATKAGLHAMTQALRFDLRGTRVRVIEVMPPAVDTAMARHYGGAKLAPAQVADRIVRALQRGDEEVVIGVSRLGRLLARVAPATGFGLMNRSEAKAARPGQP